MACPNEHPIDDRRARAALRSRSTRPFGACPSCTGLGHADGGRPGAGRPRPDRDRLRRVRMQPWSHAQRRRLLRTPARARSARSCGFDVDTPWEQLPPRRPEVDPARATTTKVHVVTRQPLRPRAVLLRRLRGCASRTSSAGTARRRATPARERFEGFMREVPCPVCAGSAAQAGVDGGHPRPEGRTQRGRQEHRRGLRAADQRGGGVPPRAGPVGPRAPDRRAGAEGDPGSGSTSCSMWASTTSSLDRPSGSLSGGEAQRIRLATQIGCGAGRRPLRARRAVDRPAPAGQPAA